MAEWIRFRFGAEISLPALLFRFATLFRTRNSHIGWLAIQQQCSNSACDDPRVNIDSLQEGFAKTMRIWAVFDFLREKHEFLHDSRC